METINFDQIKWEARKRKIKEALSDAWYETRSFMLNNREVVMCAIPVVLFGARRLAKIGDDLREDHHREKEIYDHSLGMYHELRRKMKPHEKIEFSERRKAGEPVVSILNSMRLL